MPQNVAEAIVSENSTVTLIRKASYAILLKNFKHDN